MKKNESLVEFVIKAMAENGFEVSDFKGKPGHEIVTFKNSQGETRTLRFGLTPVKPKNYRISFKAAKTRRTKASEINQNVYCCKLDYSLFYPEGGAE